MQRGGRYGTIVMLLLLAAGCAKEHFAIGKGAPAQEIEQCVKLSEKKRFEEAVQCLEIFKSRFPGSVEGQEAELRIADNHYAHKEYLIAAETYEAFLKLHPAHPKIDYAQYRLGLSYLMASPKAIDRDQGHLQDALTAFEHVLAEFPGSTYLEAAKQQRGIVREKIGNRHFYIGNFYYRTGEYIAAIPRLMEALQSYPEVKRLDEAAYKVVRAHIRLGQLEPAKEVYGRMDQAFPGSRWTTKATRLLLHAARTAHNDQEK